VATTRWLWNREASALRYCRKAVSLPEGRWVLDKIQARPADGVDSAARFYSPDQDRTLHCTATTTGDFGCE
jgi:hypothetical protein